VSTRRSTFGTLVAVLVLLPACASRPLGSPTVDKSVDLHRTSAPPSTAGTSSAAGMTVSPAATVTASTGTVGPVSSLPPTPTSRPSNIDLDPQAGAIIHVDQSDDGAAVALRIGQHLVLTLAGSWTPPRAAPAPGALGSPLRTDASHGYPNPSPATAQFSAVGIGTVQIDAVTDAACLHTRPRCLMAQRTFTVTVHVLAQRSQTEPGLDTSLAASATCGGASIRSGVRFG
jgi:hypothetical protein